MGAGFVLETDENVGEIRVADVGRDDEDHVGAAKAQAAGHGIRRVAGDGNRLMNLQACRIGHLLRRVDGARDRGNRNLGNAGDIFNGCGRGIRHGKTLGLMLAGTLHGVCRRSNRDGGNR